MLVFFLNTHFLFFEYLNCFLMYIQFIEQLYILFLYIFFNLLDPFLSYTKCIFVIIINLRLKNLIHTILFFVKVLFLVSHAFMVAQKKVIILHLKVIQCFQILFFFFLKSITRFTLFSLCSASFLFSSSIYFYLENSYSS